jgi:DNA-binding response OmpR family regulator
VDGVDSGDNVLCRTTAGDYDVIIIDATVRTPDPFDVCRSLRARGNWPIVLLLTAPGRVEDRIVGLDAGADDCLQKPLAFEELSARLRALVRRRVHDGASGPQHR